jgi:hypothetical protein
MSRRAAYMYGTQSARSGGDAHLFDNGVEAEQRMEIGSWATPIVERLLTHPNPAEAGDGARCWAVNGSG